MASVQPGWFRELFTSHKGNEGLAGSTCVRVFAVNATAKDIAARRHLFTPGVPTIGSPHPADDTLVVTDIATGERLSSDVVVVVVTYSTEATVQPWRLQCFSYNREVPYFERVQFNPLSSASAGGTEPTIYAPTNHWLEKKNLIPTPKSLLEYEIRYPYNRTAQVPITGANVDVIRAQQGQIHKISIAGSEVRDYQFQGATISSNGQGLTTLVYTWVSDTPTPAQVLAVPTTGNGPQGPGAPGAEQQPPDFILAPMRPAFWEYRTVAQVRTQLSPTQVSQPVVQVYDPWAGNRNNGVNPDGQGWRTLPGFSP